MFYESDELWFNKISQGRMNDCEKLSHIMNDGERIHSLLMDS